MKKSNKFILTKYNFMILKRTIIAILTIALLSSCGTSLNTTKIIAHRGFSDIAPENTLIAFSKAIESGTPYFELDVHKSKDGELVVIHDFTVERTSSNNSKGVVSEMTLAQLNKVKVGYSEKFKVKYSDEKIPTLREALELAKGKIKVCVEIKIENIEKPVVDLIEELGMAKQVIVFSFHYDVIKKVKLLNPKIPTLFLIDVASTKTIDDVLKINADAIGVGYGTNPTVDFVSYAHKNNIQIFKWTVNEEKQMKELIDLKLDGLITNKPDLGLKVLKSE